MKLFPVSVLVSVAFLYFTNTLLIPIILGFFLFFLLDPLVDWGASKGINRGLLAPLAVLASIALISLMIWSGYLATMNVTSQIPKYSEKIQGAFSFFEKQVHIFEVQTQSLFPISHSNENIQKVEVVQHVGSWTGFVVRGINSILEKLAVFSVIPILTLLLLLEKNHLEKQFQLAFPHFYEANQIVAEIKQMMKGFFLGNLLVSLGSGVCFFIVFTILGLDNKVALAITAGFLNIIPMVGMIVCIIFPLAQALLQFDSAGPLIFIASSSFVIHFVVTNLILPKVIGSKVNVNSVAATLGLLFWGWVWGPIGLLIAVPMTALLRIFLMMNAGTQNLSFLLADNPDTPIRTLLLPGSTSFRKRIQSQTS